MKHQQTDHFKALQEAVTGVITAGLFFTMNDYVCAAKDLHDNETGLLAACLYPCAHSVSVLAVKASDL